MKVKNEMITKKQTELVDLSRNRTSKPSPNHVNSKSNYYLQKLISATNERGGKQSDKGALDRSLHIDSGSRGNDSFYLSRPSNSSKQSKGPQTPNLNKSMTHSGIKVREYGRNQTLPTVNMQEKFSPPSSSPQLIKQANSHGPPLTRMNTTGHPNLNPFSASSPGREEPVDLNASYACDGDYSFVESKPRPSKPVPRLPQQQEEGFMDRFSKWFNNFSK